MISFSRDMKQTVQNASSCNVENPSNNS